MPQIYADIDRVKAKRDDVPLANVFDALQTYLGSLYVNDLNLFGRSYQVIAQADAPFRARKEQILDLKTRNAKGEMVPLGSVMTVRDSVGPGQRVALQRLSSPADISGQAAPGTSSTGALDALEKLARETLPAGVAFEWTDLSYQEMLSRGSSTLIFPLCVLLVFLVLAAQYESWTLPLAVILDRADVHRLRDRRAVARPAATTTSSPDRLHRAGRAGVQERDPDRRVRQCTWKSTAQPAATRRSRPAGCGCGRSS